MRRLVLALGLLISTAALCQDTGTVRLYRYSLTGSNYRGLKVYMDGSELLAVKGGHYADLQIAAGKHDLHSENKKQHLVVNVEPGKTYYVRVRFPDFPPFGGVDLISVDPDTALAETAKLKAQK